MRELIDFLKELCRILFHWSTIDTVRPRVSHKESQTSFLCLAKGTQTEDDYQIINL
jgi:hypothetical protein